MILAHGIGARADLPISPVALAWGATIALVISFGALGAMWREPRLASEAAGRPAPGWADRLVRGLVWPARLVALLLYGETLGAALFGSRFDVLNLSPFVIFVGLWVIVPMIQAVFGDVWSDVNPLDQLAVVAERLGERLGLRRERRFGHWPAVATLAGFLWLELAYHSPSQPRILGWLMVLYTIIVVGPAVVWGRNWSRNADGFAVYFGLIAHIAPLFRSGGSLRVRRPFTGLGRVEIVPGTTALLLVALGGTTFDGFSRTSIWRNLVIDRVGWGTTAVNTLGAVWVIGLVAAVYLFASRRARRHLQTDLRPEDVFASSLIPIALGYGIAHYFSLAVFEGQNLLIRLSDPYGSGINLFGTADWKVNFLIVSTATIAWVQVGAIVFGHIAAVVAAHDRALEVAVDVDEATRSQHAMLGVMVAYTITGLFLLLGA